MAWPLLTGTVATAVAPILKVTVPVGLPVFRGMTVALNVTRLFTGAGFADDGRVIWVPCGLTTSLIAADVLPPLRGSPPYIAVRGSVPTGRAVVVNWAPPLASTLVEPSETVPFVKTTVPVGAAGPLVVTFAVNATWC